MQAEKKKTIFEGQSELASRIEMYREKLNASYTRIADFILADEQAAQAMTIYEMAEKIGTSVATVTRFCQMLGYSGLADMKFHMQQQAVELNQDIGIRRDDSINVIKQKALQFDSNSLERCIMDMDNDALEKAVEMLGKADRIMLAATGSAGGVVQAAEGLLMSMGFHAFTSRDDLLQLRTAAALGKGRLLIAVSYDGQAKSTGDAMMLAKESGADTILVTSTRDSLLGRYADCILYTPARVGGNAMNITATALCQLSVLQILMLGAVTKYYDRFKVRSARQLQISDMNRYDVKQKEIGVRKVRLLPEEK